MFNIASVAYSLSTQLGGIVEKKWSFNVNQELRQPKPLTRLNNVTYLGLLARYPRPDRDEITVSSYRFFRPPACQRNP